MTLLDLNLLIYYEKKKYNNYFSIKIFFLFINFWNIEIFNIFLLIDN